MNKELLKNRLSFEPDLNTVEIIDCIEVEPETFFIRAKLGYPDQEMIVAFVYYQSDDILFTPWDWQGDMPESPEAIEKIEWRVDNSTIQGIIFNGLPRLLC